MDYETLELTRPADGVAVLTLTRPRQRNAITFQMFDEMHDLLAKVRGDADIRALIVTGEGEGFCAGLDLDDAEELPKMSANEMMLGQEHWAGAFERFHDLPQAGHRRGQRRRRGRRARPGAGRRHPHRLRERRASTPPSSASASRPATSASPGPCRGSSASAAPPRSCSPGTSSTPTEAERIGLVNRVVPADQLLDESIALAGGSPPTRPSGSR